MVHRQQDKRAIAQRLMSLTAAFFILLVLVTQTIASEQVEICAQYTNTGSSYHVTAISTTGSKLNLATRSFNYNSLSSYIVIFWAPGQATVIEMTPPFFGPTFVSSFGIDQEGRSWTVSSYSPMSCLQ